jgi:hypothetical protein
MTENKTIFLAVVSSVSSKKPGNMKVLNLGCLVFAVCIGLFACTKNSNPKTIYDTVTVTKTDTVTVQLPPPNDTPNLTNGLVLYLPFTNGSMADSSGFNNTVTAVGGATLGYDMHGFAQSAFTSNGDGQYLMIGNNGSITFDTAFSLSLDFMIRSVPDFNGIGVPGLMTLASLVNVSNGDGPMLHVGMVGYAEGGVPQPMDIGINGAANGCTTYGAGGPAQENDTTTWLPQVGAWYNLIVTFSSGSLNLYINGQNISSKTTDYTALLNCPDANFVIGGWWAGDPECINGEIDEVRVYNKTLSAQQIAWLARNFQIHSNAQRPGLQQGKTTGLPL